MELTRIWEIVKRRKWIIIQALVVIFLVAFLGSFLITPSYQAASQIMIRQLKLSGIDLGRMFQTKNINVGLTNISTIITATPDVDVNKLLASSGPIIEKMVFKLQLRDSQGNLIKSSNLTRAGMMASINNRIFPKPQIVIDKYQKTNILQISAITTDPEEAMMMANTLAEIMVVENQDQMRAEYQNARIFLQDKIQDFKQKFDTALLNLKDFRKKEKTIDLPAETQLATEKLVALLQQKEDSIIDLAKANARLKRMKEQLAKQDLAFASAATLQEAPQIEVLKKRLMELKLQYADATAMYTQEHPRVVALNQKIQLTEAELKREIANYRVSAPGLEALERQIDALEAHLASVNADIKIYLQTLGGLPDKSYVYANLDMELNTSQNIYGELLDYLHQVGIAEATAMSEIRIVDPAVLPGYPIRPNKMVNGLLGLLVGLLFGCGLAFVVDYLDDSIRTADDVKAFRPLTLIGIIPLMKKNMPILISERDPNDPIYECYRKIRTQLRYIHGRPLNSLLITSAGPGEGKSTTAVNLGISMAHEGKKVVVVDMDLRRPAIHNYLALSNRVGATNILQNDSSLAESIQKTSTYGLNIVASGQVSDDPGKLIESEQVEGIVTDLKNRYDSVIIDSAPLLVKSDALILSKYADGLIVLLESGKVTRQAVKSLLEVLEEAGIKPLGFILNKMPLGRGKFFYQEFYHGQAYLPEKTI